MKSAEYKELKILQEFYSELEHTLDNAARGYRLSAIERLLDTVRTSLQQVSDDNPTGWRPAPGQSAGESTPAPDDLRVASVTLQITSRGRISSEIVSHDEMGANEELSWQARAEKAEAELAELAERLQVADKLAAALKPFTKADKWHPSWKDETIVLSELVSPQNFQRYPTLQITLGDLRRASAALEEWKGEQL